ncbi:hypothetical protein HK096_007074 [Nowakowskiella sp. JEL0078]|nr:hypothetical protein HK096_007074 [Nowakowskiella sp. JEL0078]
MNAPFAIRSQFQNVFRPDKKDNPAPSPATPVNPKMTFVRNTSRTPSPEPTYFINDNDNASSINYYDVYGEDNSVVEAESDFESIYSNNTIVHRIDRSFNKDELSSRLERLIKRRSSGSSNGSRRSRYSVQSFDEPDISPIASYHNVDKSDIERIRSLAFQSDYKSSSPKTPKISPTKLEANIDMINAAVDEALAELQNGTGSFQERKVMVIPQTQSPKEDFTAPPSHYVPPPRTPLSRAQSQDEVFVHTPPPPRSGFIPVVPSSTTVLNAVPVASPPPIYGFVPSSNSMSNANNGLESIPARTSSKFAFSDSEEARDTFVPLPRRSRSFHGVAQASHQAPFEFKAEPSEQLPITNIYAPPRMFGPNHHNQPISQAEPMPVAQHRPEMSTNNPIYRNLVRSPPPKLHVGQRIPEEPQNNSNALKERSSLDEIPSVWPRSTNTEYRPASKPQNAKPPMSSNNFGSVTPDTASTTLNDNFRNLYSFEKERGRPINIEDEVESRTSKGRSRSLRSNKSSIKSEKGEDGKKRRKEKKKTLRKLNKMSKVMKWVIGATVVNLVIIDVVIVLIIVLVIL